MSAPGRRPIEHWVILGGSLVALIAMIVLGTWAEPDPRGHGTHEQFGMPPCRMLQITGIPCPGCGVTTSIALVAHGKLVASFWTQPFGLVLALLIPIAAVFVVYQHARGRHLGDVVGALYPKWWLIGLGAIAVAAWVWKTCVLRGWIGGA